MNREFTEFPVGEVFDIYSPKKRFNANAVHFGGKYPYVARGSANNGIRGYITEDEKYLSPARSLSFGQDTATVFYQPNAYFTGDKIKVMVLKGHELDKEIAQYFVTVISKSFSAFSWGSSSFNEKILKATKILLPVKKSADPDHDYTTDDIDYEYMRSRIAELERSRIAELDAYLKATGLDDYELTEKDREVLSTDTTQVKRRNFLLGDLFTAFTGDVDLQQKDINDKGEYFINSGVANLGIKGKTDRPAKVFPANTITIDFWGNAYYRDFEYKLATHNHVFSLTGEIIKNRLVGLYLVSLFSEFPKLFSYNNMATWNKLKKMKIALPITSAGEVDYAYMENYIRAMEKVTIADVVKYKDKVIETTKAVGQW